MKVLDRTGWPILEGSRVRVFANSGTIWKGIVRHVHEEEITVWDERKGFERPARNAQCKVIKPKRIREVRLIDE